MVLLYVGACAAVSGGADQLEVVVAVAPHPKKVTMAAVALADSRKLLDQSTHLGDLAVAAVELADQQRIEPASMADHHEPASKEG